MATFNGSVPAGALTGPTTERGAVERAAFDLPRRPDLTGSNIESASKGSSNSGAAGAGAMVTAAAMTGAAIISDTVIAAGASITAGAAAGTGGGTRVRDGGTAGCAAIMGCCANGCE